MSRLVLIGFSLLSTLLIIQAAIATPAVNQEGKITVASAENCDPINDPRNCPMNY